MWGGVECTVNRVGDRTFDQFDWNGHAARLDDLDRFAALGIRTLRTPVLWERVAPDGLGRADWAWADASLGRMRDLGIEPVVGFVHHGSGPPSTSLVDPAFADGLAGFARAFAERHPGVEAFTPVNEPLTTARFSGLYGHWYPHGRDVRTFARALVTQIQAVAQAMQAVREVTPAARLIQTEDLGWTWSTPALAGRAAADNERRWLTWDLLCGRVDRAHPMWAPLVRWGIGEHELDAFVERPCPPDVVGVNHYVTSERFLDDRVTRYPPHLWNGDEAVRHVDVEAVRAVSNGPAGLASLLVETSERYGLPVAVTEAHLGCTREEQVRWLAEAWRAAGAARAAGADVRAVTAWALLGSFDWDSLLTDCRGHYEPGAFDVRSDPPRQTALAGIIRALASGDEPDHAVLDSPGWWRLPFRFSFEPSEAIAAPAHPPRLGVAAVVGTRAAPRPVLVLGSDLPLGDAAVRLCGVRGLACETLVRAEAGALGAALARGSPWAVVDALSGGAGSVGAALALLDPDAAGHRAACVAAAGAALVTFSSDAVFAPRAAPYTEADVPNGVGPRGRAQATADRAVQAAHPGALVVRTAPWLSPWGRAGRIHRALDTVADGRPLRAETLRGAAVNLADAVHAALDLLVDGERGVWHLALPGAESAADLLHIAVRHAGLDAALVVPDPVPGTRVALVSGRGQLLASADDSVGHFLWRDAGWAPPARRHRAPAQT